ncbi:MAG: DUF2059 domain-containing protein [Pseudomonadota bacterium]
MWGLSLAPALADDVDRLLTLWRVDDLIIDAESECRENTRAMLSGTLRLDEQRRRHKIAPDDPDWQRLVGIYDDFYQDACSFVSIEEQRAVYRELLETRFDATELAALVAFYGSELGEKLISLELDANRAVQTLYAERYAAHTDRAKRRLRDRIAKWLRDRRERRRHASKQNAFIGPSIRWMLTG